MAIFLNWRNLDIGGVDRYIADLFSYLSRRWYPVNVIDSTVYDTFAMYANELASASVEVTQLYDDLYINSVRTSPVLGHSSSKMYENFGELFSISKLLTQEYDMFNFSTGLQSYRQELRLIMEASFAATSYEGISRVGQAFTGVSPLLIDPTLEYPGWVLTTYSGSVGAVGTGFLVSTVAIPEYGYVFSTGSLSPFSVGDDYTLSYSKLGVNTIILDAQDAYNGIGIFVYAPSGSASSSSFRSLVESNFSKFLRADVIPEFYYVTDYTYYRPQTGSIPVVVDSVFSLHQNGYLYNTAPSGILGHSFVGKAIQLPSGSGELFDVSGYNSFEVGTGSVPDYYYDWLVLTRNDAQYTFGVRTYPDATIPETVYFKDYDPEPVELFPVVSGSLASHWIFDDVSTFWDIGGSKANMTLLYGTAPTSILGRNETHRGAFTSGQGFFYTYNTSPVLNFSSSCYGEMWVKGIDTSGASSINALTVKNDLGFSSLPLVLGGNGYLFGIKGSNQTLLFTLSGSGGTQTFSASIASYFSEAPSRYHYFAFSFASGSVYLYADDEVLLSAASASVSLPPIVGSPELSIVASGSGIGIDEMVLSDGFLTPEQAAARFEATKPRLTRIGVDQSEVYQYHQPKLTIYASGSEEVEFHQFSIRAWKTPLKYVRNRTLSDMFRVPIFKSGSV